jgi:hypothetical protein
MKSFLVFLLPWVSFFTAGKPISGLFCLILQLTVIGWIPAILWSFSTLARYETERSLNTALACYQKYQGH